MTANLSQPGDWCAGGGLDVLRGCDEQEGDDVRKGKKDEEDSKGPLEQLRKELGEKEV